MLSLSESAWSMLRSASPSETVVWPWRTSKLGIVEAVAGLPLTARAVINSDAT